MPTLVCPQCHAAIEPSDVNVATDVAFCRSCSKAFSLSGMVAANRSRSEDPQETPVDVNNPPKGAWFNDLGSEYHFGASTRSYAAFFLVPFMIVWSGGSLGGIYGSQIVSGKFDLFMSLFGLPFLAGSVLFWGLALMSIWGRVDIRLRGDEGTVFTGIGPIGRRQKFQCSDISVVREEVHMGPKQGPQFSIILEGGKRLKFGTMLSTERRYFVMQVLKMLVNPPAKSTVGF